MLGLFWTTLSKCSLLMENNDGFCRWGKGYTEKFGLHSVNMSSPERGRAAKESSIYFGSIAQNNGFPQEGDGPCTIG